MNERESLLPSPSQMLAEIIADDPSEAAFWDWLAERLLDLEMEQIGKPNIYRRLMKLGEPEGLA
jgi:hypothetical protein